MTPRNTTGTSAHGLQGSQGSRQTRRRFLKRTGGATAATVLTWVLHSEADAETTVTSAKGSRAPNWKIRSEEVGSTEGYLDLSWGPQTDWTWGAEAKKVRKVLKLYAHAPEDPADVQGRDQWATSATANVSIDVWEWAEIAPVVNGEAGEWEAMTVAQWESWTGEDADNSAHASTTASLEKSIDDTTAVEPSLTVTATPSGNDDDTTSEEGIFIKLEWNGDTLNIIFRALGLGIEENDYDLETMWHLKNFGGDNSE